MLKLVIAIVLMSSLVYASETTTNEAQTLDSLASILQTLVADHKELKDALLGTTTKSSHPVKKVAGAVGNVARFAFKNLANTAIATVLVGAIFEGFIEEHFFRPRRL